MSGNRGERRFMRHMQYLARSLDSFHENFLWGIASELQRKDIDALRRRVRYTSKAALSTGEAAMWKLCNDMFVFVERRI